MEVCAPTLALTLASAPADASCANAGAARARAVQSALAISVFWITVRLLVRPRRIRGTQGRLRTGVPNASGDGGRSQDPFTPPGRRRRWCREIGRASCRERVGQDV